MAEQLELDFLTPEQKEIIALKQRIIQLEMEINALKFRQFNSPPYNPCNTPPYTPWYPQIVCKGGIAY